MSKKRGIGKVWGLNVASSSMLDFPPQPHYLFCFDAYSIWCEFFQADAKLGDVGKRYYGTANGMGK